MSKKKGLARVGMINTRTVLERGLADKADSVKARNFFFPLEGGFLAVV